VNNKDLPGDDSDDIDLEQIDVPSPLFKKEPASAGLGKVNGNSPSAATYASAKSSLESYLVGDKNLESRYLINHSTANLKANMD